MRVELMEHRQADLSRHEGWGWFENEDQPWASNEDLIRAFARCLKGSDGANVIDHLRRTVLERRLGPRASDNELRFLEGQRSVVAHIIEMVGRGNGQLPIDQPTPYDNNSEA